VEKVWRAALGGKIAASANQFATDGDWNRFFFS
jgi:hypothetical protein